MPLRIIPRVSHGSRVSQEMVIGLFLIAVVLAVAGWGIALQAKSIIQGGTITCTVPINGTNCTTSTITFSTPYANVPTITAFQTLSPLEPQHSVSVPGATLTNLITYQTPGNQTRLISDDET